MARQSKATDDHLTVERTRTSAAYIGIAVSVLFLILLIIFIAQNNRKVPLHFFGASGNVSEALAILGSAVAGAVIVLLIGTARIVQLRLNTRRHNKAARRQVTNGAPSAESGAAPSEREAQPVDAQR